MREDALDAARGGLGKFGIAGVGHLGREIEEGLLAVAEMRGDDELAGFSEAEAAAQVLEAALHGERGRGEHDGGDLVEDQLAEERGDIDGRGLEKSGAGLGARTGLASAGRPATAWAASWTDVVTGPARRSSQKTMLEALDSSRNSSSERRRAMRFLEAGRFVDFSEALHLGLKQLEGGADGEIEFAGGFEELFAIGEGMAAVGGERQRGEEHAGALAELLGEGGHGCGALLAAQEHVDVAGQLFKANVRDREAEVIGGDFFELVGLVEDHGGGFGQDAGVGRARRPRA